MVPPAAQGDTPYGTPYGSFGSLSSMQTPPHSLSGYSPMHSASRSGGQAGCFLGTPARSAHLPSSLQVPATTLPNASCSLSAELDMYHTIRL